MWTEATDNRLVFTNPPVNNYSENVMKQIRKVHRLLRSATQAITVWQRKKNDRLHLQELDDRLLADIGLSRTDLH